jgi:tetratricopeptide (TPR) repeat protein
VLGNYYRPLFLLWFRLNHAVFGLNPPGWHLSTILCHVAVTYLVFALIRRLAKSAWIPFCSATLFAVHPVHLESVAWVSGVTDPLMAVFLIAAFLAYLRFREEGHAKWMAAALGWFCLALLAKETAVVLGVLVFLYAWLYSETRAWASRFATALRHSLAFFALTLLYLAVRARVLHGLSHTVTPLSMRTMALTEPSVVWLYVRHLLFPVGLSGLYGLPYVQSARSAAFVVPMAALLFVSLTLAWGLRRLKDSRLGLFAFGWLVLPILPALWLRTYAEGDIAHDRYLYVPSVGFVLLLALFGAEIARRWPARDKQIQLAALVGFTLAYGAGAFAQQTFWASDLLLYTRAYRIAPQDNLIANDLGTELMEAGDPRGAMTLYLQVLARKPDYWLANYNLGYAYYKTGRFRDAEARLRHAISINAADSDEFMYLGLSVWRQGRVDEAAQWVERAIEIRPTAQGYHYVLGMIRRDQNNLPAARSELNLELQNYPGTSAARQQLGLLDGAATGPK